MSVPKFIFLVSFQLLWICIPLLVICTCFHASLETSTHNTLFNVTIAWIICTATAVPYLAMYTYKAIINIYKQIFK